MSTIRVVRNTKMVLFEGSRRSLWGYGIGSTVRLLGALRNMIGLWVLHCTILKIRSLHLSI